MKGLTKQPDYKKLLKTQSLLVSKEFSLRVGDNKVGVARLGIIVPKKHIKRAVSRNKARRIARAVFQEFKGKFVNKDVVLLIKGIDNSLPRQVWKEKMRRAYFWLEYFMSR